MSHRAAHCIASHTLLATYERRARRALLAVAMVVPGPAATPIDVDIEIGGNDKDFFAEGVSELGVNYFATSLPLFDRVR